MATGLRALHRALGDVHLHEDVVQSLQELLVGWRIFGHVGRQLIGAADQFSGRADRLPVQARNQAGNELGIEVDLDLLLLGDLKSRRDIWTLD